MLEKAMMLAICALFVIPIVAQTKTWYLKTQLNQTRSKKEKREEKGEEKEARRREREEKSKKQENRRQLER